MAFDEIQFPSYNEQDMIKAWIYKPICQPRGVIQIVHGFGEHSRRYLHMILKLNEQGFVVAADDHVGHGKTARDSDNWSDWGDKGYWTMVEDEHRLRQKVQEQYPQLSFFMFGHSLGSMIARNYVTTYGKGLDGLIMCGTSGKFPKAAELIPKLEKLIDEGEGRTVQPELLAEFMGWMTERIPQPQTPNDWISADADIVNDHANDPLNNLTTPPNIRSLYQFAKMAHNIVGIQWAEQVPTSVPIYNMAGDQDPVGLYGEGVYATSNWLAATGHDVQTKVYPGHRHEIHNDRDIRDDVEDAMVAFINNNIT